MIVYKFKEEVKDRILDYLKDDWKFYIDKKFTSEERQDDLIVNKFNNMVYSKDNLIKLEDFEIIQEP